MSFDRGPGQGPAYSGNFTTQGGALYAGDGQNAGRDIISQSNLNLQTCMLFMLTTIQTYSQRLCICPEKGKNRPFL
jgi:hypothetical protein